MQRHDKGQEDKRQGDKNCSIGRHDGERVHWRRLMTTLGLVTVVGVASYSIGHSGVKGTAVGAYQEVKKAIAPDLRESSKAYARKVAREKDISRYQGDLFAVADTIIAHCNEDSVARHLAAAGRERMWEKSLAYRAGHATGGETAGLLGAIFTNIPAESLSAISDSLASSVAVERQVAVIDNMYTALPGDGRGEVNKHVLKESLVSIKDRITTTLDNLLR